MQHALLIKFDAQTKNENLLHSNTNQEPVCVGCYATYIISTKIQANPLSKKGVIKRRRHKNIIFIKKHIAVFPKFSKKFWRKRIVRSKLYHSNFNYHHSQAWRKFLKIFGDEKEVMKKWKRQQGALKIQVAVLRLELVFCLSQKTSKTSLEKVVESKPLGQLVFRLRTLYGKYVPMRIGPMIQSYSMVCRTILKQFLQFSSNLLIWCRTDLKRFKVQICSMLQRFWSNKFEVRQTCPMIQIF